uniref:Autophagy protein 5 n=1 Tax=Caenorhabditis tropicalis TaxID=1561998 RepID=A0A1I7UUY1_9PELO
MDYEVSRKVWESQVPVQFTLQSGGTLGDPLPYYTMLPRFTYLALALPKALTSFNRREDGETIHVEKVWLEANGKPLKMYIPIGVINDQANLLETDSILEISVKTSTAPPKFQMVDRDMMEAMFMQNIKEADYLKTKAEVTQSMMKDELPQLWRSVVNNNFDEFWGINRKLMETNNEFSHVPLRIYYKDEPFKQALLTIKHTDGSLRTIGESIAEILRLSPPTSSESSTPTSESSSSSSDATPSGERRLISHGIDIPSHTPLIFAAKNLSYPDNFVHIVISV